MDWLNALRFAIPTFQRHVIRMGAFAEIAPVKRVEAEIEAALITRFNV